MSNLASSGEVAPATALLLVILNRIDRTPMGTKPRVGCSHLSDRSFGRKFYELLSGVEPTTGWRTTTIRSWVDHV